jgi:hypothetical protein
MTRRGHQVADEHANDGNHGQLHLAVPCSAHEEDQRPDIQVEDDSQDESNSHPESNSHAWSNSHA